MLSKKKVEEIANKNILISDLSDDELAEFCIIANQMYRNGEHIVSDQDYDFVFLAALCSVLGYKLIGPIIFGASLISLLIYLTSYKREQLLPFGTGMGSSSLILIFFL